MKVQRRVRATGLLGSTAIFALTGWLGTAQAVPVTATWNSGAGSWTDANWTFSTPPGVVFPDNNATHQFNVRIDNSNPAVSVVSLDSANVTVDSLNIDSAEKLNINNRSFTIVRDASRAASGQVVNAGTINVNSAAAGTASVVVSGGDVKFSGGGTLNLTGPANTVVFSPDKDPDTLRSNSAIFGNGTLINQNHTIAGTGEIGFFDMGIKNLTDGVIDANVAGSALVVAGKDLTSPSGVGATNLGTMQASNGGILRLFSGTYQQTDGVNQGTILAKAGSTVQIENSGVNINGGSLKSESTGAILIRETGATLTGTAVNNAGAMTLIDGNGFGPNVASTLSLDAASSFTNSGTVDITHSSLGLTGTPVTNSGVMSVTSTANGAASITIAGAVTFSGGGTLNLAGPANTVVFSPDEDPDTVRSSSAIFGNGTLTNQNHTIAGTGEIGFFDMGIKKNLTGGVIDANVAGSALVVAGKDLTSPSGVGATNLGTMQASNGGILRLFQGRYQQTDGVTQGTIVAKAGSTVQIENSGVQINGGSLKTQSGGTTLIRQAFVQLLGTAVDNAGTFILAEGNGFAPHVPATLSLDAASSFTNSGTVEIANSFLITAGSYVQTAGNTKLDNGTLTATAGVSIDGGTLSGNGTINGDLKNSGSVAPGNSAGLLTVTGEFDQTATGLLDIEIGGLTPTEYDRVIVNARADLDGTLRIRLISGFDLLSDAFFDVLFSGGGIAGAFATFDAPVTLSGRWDVEYLADRVRVTFDAIDAVPEPPALAMMLFGLAILLVRRSALRQKG